MKAVIVAATMLVLSGCSFFEGFVYRIDIPQGNYLEQRDVDKLRVGMSKEQVEFVLGAPVAASAFSQDTWHYIYHMDPNKGEVVRKELVLTFEEGSLTTFAGDFDRPEDFDTPLDQ